MADFLRRVETVPAPSGDQYYFRYAERYSDDGQPFLVETEKIDIQDYVNSNLEATDIKSIIKRFSDAGEPVNLADSGLYLDVSAMPTSLMEAQNLILSASDAFNKLPIEIRDFYHQNIYEFLSKIKDFDFENMKPKEASAVNIESEVNENADKQ